MRNTIQLSTSRIDLVQRPGRDIVATGCDTGSLGIVQVLLSRLAQTVGNYERLSARYIARLRHSRPVVHLVRALRPMRFMKLATINSWADKRKTPLACPSFAVKRS